MRSFKSLVTPKRISEKLIKVIYDISSLNSSKNKHNRYASDSLLDKMASSKFSFVNLFRAMKHFLMNVKTELFLFLDDHISIFDPLNRWKVTFDVILILGVILALFFKTIEVSF